MKLKRTAAAVVAAVMAFTAVATPLGDNIPALEEAFSAGAYYSVKDNFYPVTLTGDGAVDMVNVAVAQTGRKDDDDGWYPNREAWCADFVLDVARVAGQTGAVPDAPANAACGTFRNALVKAGAIEVETAQAGDLVFYCSTSGDTTYHVGIMKDSRYSVEGNALLNGVFQVVDNRDTMTYTTTKGLSIANGDIKRVFIRPNYSNSSNDIGEVGITASDLANKFNWLSTQYKDGEYWNQYNSAGLNGTGPNACPCEAKGYGFCANPRYYKDGCPCSCGYYTNDGVVQWQCFGYASKFFYLTFGVNANKSNIVYNLNEVYAGDIIRYNRHSIFVTKVVGDTITFTDCNYTGACKVRWNGTINKNSITAFEYRYHMSGNTIKDPWSTPVKDSTPPNLTSLGEEDWNRNGMGFFIKANATDNVGVTKIAFTVSANGRTKDYQANLEKNNTYGWQYISVSDFSNFLGTYSISCVAYDACGNKSNVRSMTVTLDKGTAPTVADKTIKEGTYCLRNGVGLNMDVRDGTDDKGNRVIFHPHNGSDAQLMKFIYKGNGKYLISPKCSSTGKVIDVYRPTNGNMNIDWGDKIDMYPNDDDEAQEFYVVPVGNGDYVLELASKDNFVIGGKHTYNDADFYLQPYLNFAPSQRFRFTDASGNAVDVCNHSYKETRTEPTCTAGGKLTKVCKYCGKKVEETINAPGHSWSGWSTTTYPTCTAQGVEQRTCSRCSKAETRYITALGHNYSSEWRIDKQATCSAEGSKSKHCTRCSSVTEVTAIPKTAHSYKTTVVAPTLTSQGYTVHECTVCHYSYKDSYTSQITLSAVTGAKVKTQGTTSLTLAWDKNASANGYVVEQYKGGKWTQITKTASNAVVSYTVNGLKADTTYTFRIKGYVVSGTTEYSSEYTRLAAKTRIANVGTFKGSTVSDSAVKLDWSKNDKATGYVIEQYKGGKWTVLATTKNNTTLTFTVKGLAEGTAYSFRIKSFRKTGSTTEFSEYTAIKAATLLDGVSDFKVTSVTGSWITLEWAKNDKATGYSIEQYKGGKWTALATTKNNTTLTFTVKGLASATVYSFRIKSFRKAGGKIEYSEYASLKAATSFGGVNNLTVKSYTASTITLVWNKNAGATGYALEQYKGGKWVRIAKTSSNAVVSYTVSGLAADTTYTFRVRAYKTAAGKTIYSEYARLAAKTRIAKVATFTGSAVSASAVKLDWRKNDKATGYVIEQYKGGKWTVLATTKNNTTLTFTVKGLAKGTIYSFRIKAFRKTGSTTEFSEYSGLKAATRK